MKKKKKKEMKVHAAECSMFQDAVAACSMLHGTMQQSSEKNYYLRIKRD
jgi:hypothetical protein